MRNAENNKEFRIMKFFSFLATKLCITKIEINSFSLTRGSGLVRLATPYFLYLDNLSSS
jgi:hypothetical protein